METLLLPANFGIRKKAQFMELTQQGISEKVFEEVYKTFFKALHAYAHSILVDYEHAEEMVQQVFLKLWERKERIEINTSIQAYLYRSVYNESMNFLKHEKVKQAHVSFVKHTTTESSNSHHKNIDTKELEGKIRVALNKLPEQCRTVFQLSRFEELKYREIAERLQLSVKTVENQMGKALKIMRTELAAYLPTLWLVLICLFNGIIK
jgi:RNA polymerase sigma-70 factor (ECF subfamily)